VKRKNEAGTAPPKAIEAEGHGADDMIVAAPRHHLLDEFAARPRLRNRRPGPQAPPSAD
jgi:hypothetical protein